MNTVEMPMKRALFNAAREIERLSGLAQEIDDALGTALRSGAGVPPAQMQTLQQVDLLRQSLECITDFLGQVARQSQEGEQICLDTAVKNIPLRDLAQKLASGMWVAADPPAPENGQDVMFF
mgnify:CR=1 FL=1